VEGKLQLLLVLGGGAWWVVRGLARKRMAEQRRQNAVTAEPDTPPASEPVVLEAEMASGSGPEPRYEEAPAPEVEPRRSPERVAVSEPASVAASPTEPREEAAREIPVAAGPLTGRALRNAVIMSEVLRRPGERR